MKQTVADIQWQAKEIKKIRCDLIQELKQIESERNMGKPDQPEVIIETLLEEPEKLSPIDLSRLKILKALNGAKALTDDGWEALCVLWIKYKGGA